MSVASMGLSTLVTRTRRPLSCGSFHYPPGTPRHALYMAAERFLARRTDVFVFESGYIAGRFRAYVGETDRVARVVHNDLAMPNSSRSSRMPSLSTSCTWASSGPARASRP